jgi:ankyrin repeat protein
MNLLLEQGAISHVKSYWNQTEDFIFEVIQNNLRTGINFLLGRDPDLVYSDYFYRGGSKEGLRHLKSLLTDQKTFEYLEKALERKDYPAACVFLNRFSSIDISDTKLDFKSLLFKVAAYGDPSNLDILMNRSSRSQLGNLFNDNIDRQDEQGKTALHHAIENGNVAMVEALVKKYGADINAKDKKGKTPIFLAEGSVKNEVMDIFKASENTIFSMVRSLLFPVAKSSHHNPRDDEHSHKL